MLLFCAGLYFGVGIVSAAIMAFFVMLGGARSSDIWIIPAFLFAWPVMTYKMLWGKGF